MSNFSIKSVILGIGIGVILTSAISIIYLAGSNPVAEMSREQIIEKAKEYGMVEDTELLKGQTSETSPVNKEKLPNGEKNAQQFKESMSIADVKASTDIETSTGKQKPEEGTINNNHAKTSEEAVKFTIYPGDSAKVVANKLFYLGLISDKNSFIEELTDAGLTTEIVYGDYDIKKGTELKELIRILTGRK